MSENSRCDSLGTRSLSLPGGGERVLPIVCLFLSYPVVSLRPRGSLPDREAGRKSPSKKSGELPPGRTAPRHPKPGSSRKLPGEDAWQKTGHSHRGTGKGRFGTRSPRSPIVPDSSTKSPLKPQGRNRTPGEGPGGRGESVVEKREKTGVPSSSSGLFWPLPGPPRTTKTLSSPRGENEKTGADPRGGGTPNEESWAGTKGGTVEGCRDRSPPGSEKVLGRQGTDKPEERARPP